MKFIVHEQFKLRPGMTVHLLDGPARVVRVTACAAVCVRRVTRRAIIRGKPVLFHQDQILRISPNSEIA